MRITASFDNNAKDLSMQFMSKLNCLRDQLGKTANQTTNTLG